MKTPALLLAFLVTLAALHGTATAGTTGKISALVTDPGSGEPVVGANVTVTGTSLGPATDSEGRYVIINVPPGSWEIRISAVGYTATTVRQVRVNADQTTIITARSRPRRCRWRTSSSRPSAPWSRRTGPPPFPWSRANRST